MPPPPPPPPAPPAPPGMMNLVVSAKALAAPAASAKKKPAAAPADRGDFLAAIAGGAKLKKNPAAAAAAASALADVLPDISGNEDARLRSGSDAFPNDPRMRYLRQEQLRLSGKGASISDRVRLSASKKELGVRRDYLSKLLPNDSQLVERIYNDLNEECKTEGKNMVYWDYRFEAKMPNEYYAQRDEDLLEIARAVENNRSSIVNSKSYKEVMRPSKRCVEEHTAKVARLQLEKQLKEATLYEEEVKKELANWDRQQPDLGDRQEEEFLKRLEAEKEGGGAGGGAASYKRVRAFSLAKWQGNREFEIVSKGPKMPQIWSVSDTEQRRHPEILRATAEFAGGVPPFLRKLEEEQASKLDVLIPGWRDWNVGAAAAGAAGGAADQSARVKQLEAQVAALRSELLMAPVAPPAPALVSSFIAQDDEKLNDARSEIARLESELKSARALAAEAKADTADPNPALFAKKRAYKDRVRQLEKDVKITRDIAMIIYGGRRALVAASRS